MPFERPYVSLIINGVNYTKEALLNADYEKRLVVRATDKTWLRSLHNFLIAWIDENEFVTVSTSGSTGTPKQIELSKERMMQSAFMTGKYFDFKSGQTALLCLPCDYIAGKMMVVRAIMWGLDLQLVPPSGNPMVNIEQLIHFGAMVPLQVVAIFEQSPEKFKWLKQLIIGGGKVDASLQKKLQSIDCQCFATYGMTETITHVAIKKLNGYNQTDYFQGLDNIQFSVDERSCLVINAPQLSAEKVLTNDIVELKNSQQFAWLGRFDNVINTGGVKVFPETIEEKLERLIMPRFFITSLPDQRLENKVVLLIEDQKWSEAQLNQLRVAIDQVLTKFERPKQIFFLPKFAETPTNKIQRDRTKSQVKKFIL
ncbi:MAG: AMP-binding protein [Bacteroidota bacterium]